jgi:ComF family protein
LFPSGAIGDDRAPRRRRKLPSMKFGKYWERLQGCQPDGEPRVYGLVELALARVFPPRCLLCLDPGQPPVLDLCSGCEADLARDVPACTGCARLLPQPDVFLCGDCLRSPRVFDAAFAAYRYQHPLDWLVQRMKYGGDIAAARVLGTLLGRRLRAGHALHVEALVPVPLHRAREADRGFNQAIEIARAAGREVALPVVYPVARRRATTEQAGLDALTRRHNLRGAFELLRPLAQRRVAIVDDVMTTGSTVEELARVLKAGGARWVEAWAVARA